MENKFTEEDKKKIIDFLNMVAKHSKFTLNTVELIEYFKLLSHMQQTIIPKINANIFEIKKVVEVEQPKEEKSKKSKG